LTTKLGDVAVIAPAILVIKNNAKITEILLIPASTSNCHYNITYLVWYQDPKIIFILYYQLRRKL